jgi:hypothetical protein
MNDANLNLASLSNLFVDEDAAREFLEKRLWPEGPVCPHCGGKQCARLTAAIRWAELWKPMKHTSVGSQDRG